MKPYTPQPGTIPHRTIEHLKTLPPGTELSTAAIGEALGQPTASLTTCLASPLNHGLLASRRHPNGYMMWRLGAGTPTPPPADREPDEPLHPVPKVPKKPASPFDLRQPRAIKPRDTPAPVHQAAPVAAPAPAPEPEPASAPDADRAKFGAYSDGTFCVQRGVDAIWLTSSEADELLAFIQARK